VGLFEDYLAAAKSGKIKFTAIASVDAGIHTAIRFAHDILRNGWTEPGSRLDRLRTIAAALKQFNEEKRA